MPPLEQKGTTMAQNTRRNRSQNAETETVEEFNDTTAPEEATEVESTEEPTEATEAVEQPAVEEATSVTVYSAAKVVNKWLKDRGATKSDGSPKELPPQMFYNYTTARIRKGGKPANGLEVIEVAGKHHITNESLAAWFEAYYAKNIAPKNTGTGSVEQESETVDA